MMGLPCGNFDHSLTVLTVYRSVTNWREK